MALPTTHFNSLEFTITDFLSKIFREIDYEKIPSKNSHFDYFDEFFAKLENKTDFTDFLLKHGEE